MTFETRLEYTDPGFQIFVAGVIPEMKARWAAARATAVGRGMLAVDLPEEFPDWDVIKSIVLTVRERRQLLKEFDGVAIGKAEAWFANCFGVVSWEVDAVLQFVMQDYDARQEVFTGSHVAAAWEGAREGCLHEGGHVPIQWNYRGKEGADALGYMREKIEATKHWRN